MRDIRVKVLFLALLAPIMSALILGCSDYDYYCHKECPDARSIEKNVLWTAKLPYSSGGDMKIDVVGEDRLIVTEPGKNYNLSLINAKSSKPVVKHTRLKHGKFHQMLDDKDMILVIGRNKEDYFVYSLDSESLQQKYEHKIEFKKEGKAAIPGIELSSGYMIFHQSDVKIDHKFIGTTGYPYVDEIRYSFQILDIENGEVKSCGDISSNQLSSLERIWNMYKDRKSFADFKAEDFKNMSRNSEYDIEKTIAQMATGIPNVEKMLFLIDKVFLVDDNKTIVFSLSNDEVNLHYSFDVRRGASSLEESTASELADRYDELTVEVKDPDEKKEEDRKITISGVEYKFEDLKFVKDSLIVVTKCDPVGTMLVCADFQMALQEKDLLKKRWELNAGIPYYMESIQVIDRENGLIYLPQVTKDKSFILRGFRLEDGKPIKHYLPANFLVRKKTKVIEVAGTTFDFPNGRMYIHDKDKHQIICAKLPEPPSEQNVALAPK